MDITKESFSVWERVADKLLNDSSLYGFDIRITGGIAIRLKCQHYNGLFERFGRKYGDIDLVCLSKDSERIRRYFSTNEAIINQEVYTFSEGKRMIFENYQNNLKVEVFVNELNFCHQINLKNRFTIDYPTISLADLLLSKLQIVEISERDFIDLTVLLLQCKLSSKDDRESINARYISKLLAEDWGFYHTVITNLEALNIHKSKIGIQLAQKKKLEKEIDTLRSKIENEKKSIKWKTRALIGEKIKWYNEVS